MQVSSVVEELSDLTFSRPNLSNEKPLVGNSVLLPLFVRWLDIKARLITDTEIITTKRNLWYSNFTPILRLLL